MDNIKNDKTEKEIEEKVSEKLKKDIKKLLSDKEGRTPSESLGKEWRRILSGGTEKNEAFKKHSENYNDRQSSRKHRRAGSKKSLPPLKDLREKDKEEKKAKEKFQNKLSKINRQSVKNIKRNVKERSRKIAERRKVAFKKKLKEKMKKKLTMNAKQGKSIHMTCLFAFMMFLAFFNDVLLDILVAMTVEIIALAISLTGIGAAVGLPIIAFVESAGNVIDAATGIILTIFSLYIGGHTKAGMKKGLRSLAKYVGGFIIELIPILNLFVSWMVVVASDWLAVRKRAEKAEAMDEEINQISGR
ncbi:MAG: hypothetical protein KAQ87_01965 [Candidatus Pacebacteria bacterium]|nr:hypothetical protein [Candidatus Paceibacterota bacterium]